MNKQQYKGLKYRCPKCESLYAYAKRCEECGIKTVLRHERIPEPLRSYINSISEGVGR